MRLLREHVRLVVALTLALLVSGMAIVRVSAQYDNLAQQRARQILQVLRDEIKKNYYDPKFHGIDVDTHFQAATERLAKATTWGQANGVIAQALLAFDDSHLYYVPPSRAARVSYGWSPVLVGDHCYVRYLKPKGAAAKLGMLEGDEVLTLQGVKPTRSELWKMTYFFNTLSPGVPMKLTIKSPGGQPRDLVLEPVIKQTQRLFDSDNALDLIDAYRAYESDNEAHQFESVGDVTIWKMESFAGGPGGALDGWERQVDAFDRMMNEKLKGSGLVLDLRGNGGGSVDILEHLAGKVFDHEVKLADLTGRKQWKPMMTSKKRAGGPYAGKIVVLIDSRSASASEIFARVIQLEKRGTVIGDRSAGGVMQAMYYDGQMSAISYGASITNADVIMSDGKSIEHVGVTPDERLLPTAEDIAAGRDPVLSKAVSLLGQTLEPEKAGKLFPIRWRKD